MKKRKKAIIGWAINNWGMVMKRTNLWDFNYVEHDKIYRQPDGCVKTKVRITIQEI